MIAEILCIGTELLMGQVLNTNAQFLSRRLAALGVTQQHQTVVGDNADRLEAAYRLALSRADVVITSGGLGPTVDDITKRIAAKVAGKELVHFPQAEEMTLLSRLLDKPLRRFSRILGVNETSALGLLACLATSMGVCEMMERMDKKGALINSAFMISAAFVFADHLAFTMAFDASCVPAVTVGKLVAGVLAILVANVLYIPMSKRLGESAAA